jgi:hypothetical protein
MEKSRYSRDIVSAVEVEDVRNTPLPSPSHVLTNRLQSLPVLKKTSKRPRAYSFLQLDNSPPCCNDVDPTPKFDSHNQPIPPSLQLKRYGSSQRYNSCQYQLVQDLSVRLITVVLPKQYPPPPRPQPRKILNEDIRVRKLRGDKYDLSYCLPKTQVTLRPPSPLRKELARAS